MNSLWLLPGTAIAAGSIYATLRMRRQVAGYRHKIRHLQEKLAALQQQLHSNERLDALLSDVNEAVLRLNSSCMVIAANPCAREVFAIGNEALPLPMLRLYRDADWNAMLIRAIADLPAKTKLPQIELPERILEPRIARLDNGEVLLLCLDVSMRHRLEQQRRTFLSNLMHDLKTPLTSLLGYARSMESFGDQADFRKEAAAVIADEAKHVNHLLDVLLTLDQAEFGQKNAGACCDGIEVIRRACNMLEPQCVEQQITLQCEYDGAALPLVASFDDVDRIVTNLLVNAINHAPEGSQISVQLQRRGEYCAIAIEDEGPGIPEKHLPRVTERFYRVDKARSRQHNSHGLGLAIVKELLDGYGGALSLRNRKPHGLRAEFTLPITAAPASDPR